MLAARIRMPVGEQQLPAVQQRLGDELVDVRAVGGEERQVVQGRPAVRAGDCSTTM
jgi:hypothetical protein